MKKILFLLMIIFTASCGSDRTGPVSGDPQQRTGARKTASALTPVKGQYREGELLVKFRPGVSSASALKSHQSISSSVKRRFASLPGLEHVRLSEGVTVKDALAVYMADPSVEYAEPNYIRRAAQTIPNDPLFDQQWALLNTGQAFGWLPGADIKAADAWGINTGSDTVIVAVLDSGIDLDHPDLADNIWINTREIIDNGVDDDANGKIDDWQGWNFVSGNNYPFDDEGHGTHVAGIIGALCNNGIGICGVNWRIKLMAVKTLDDLGEGTVADEVDGIGYAVANGARVINASFTGDFFSNAEFDAIDAARRAGVLFTAASGNGGVDSIGDSNDVLPQYPANYKLSNIISVTSTDTFDRRAFFANFGINSVHVAAPGVDILSTYSRAVLGTGYKTDTGTSMSAPFVAGLAGLLSSQYPGSSYLQIRGMILRYVDVLPTLDGFIYTGGRVNAYKALTALLPPSGFTVSPVSGNQATLGWTDNAAGEDGYIIERAAAGGGFTRIAITAADAHQYTDSQITDGRPYTYRVKAYSRLPEPTDGTTVEGDSFTLEAAVTMPLNTPADLHATSVTNTGVTLAWTDTSQSEEGFKIERKGPDGTAVDIAVTGPGVTTFTDSGLTPSTSYTYTVRAFNTTAGESPRSPEAHVTTLEVPVKSGGGGGGCSISPQRGSKDSSADAIVMLAPLFVLMALKGLRRRKK